MFNIQTSRIEFYRWRNSHKISFLFRYRISMNNSQMNYYPSPLFIFYKNRIMNIHLTHNTMDMINNILKYQNNTLKQLNAIFHLQFFFLLKKNHSKRQSISFSASLNHFSISPIDSTHFVQGKSCHALVSITLSFSSPLTLNSSRLSVVFDSYNDD